MATQRIEFVLNGQPIAVDVEPSRSLLELLRGDLGLTGTKQACDMEGECGACTVIVDGEAQRSCLLFAGELAGRTVTTIEGLGSPDQPHPIQVAFLDAGAVQCGFCTPGMVLAAKALLDHIPHPTRPQIAKALAGNICRCTGYGAIYRAVESAAEVLAGEAESAGSPGAGRLLDDPFARHGGWQRVAGTARFAEDIRLGELHYVAFTRSPHPHATVMAVDCSVAQAIPGVIRVVTAADVPGENSLGGYSIGEHLLAPIGGKVRMVGDPVAMVVGATREIAEAGAGAVDVTYERLPHTYEVRDAFEPWAIQIHESGNLLTSFDGGSGDPDVALAKSDTVVQATYETQYQAHMAMERESAIAFLELQDGEADSNVVVIAGTHEPHWARGYLSKILGAPERRIRVVVPPTGGSFGGRQDVYPLAAVAVAARLSGKPVQLAYSRREVMEAAPKRHPYAIDITLGARCGSPGNASSARLSGLRVRVRANTGAYDAAGRYIAEYAVVASSGAYRWEGVDSRAEVLYSNGPKAGQFRGFGTPQPVFALECALDELAARLQVDPLAFRLANLLQPGEKTGIGLEIGETMGYREVLEALAGDYAEISARVTDFNEVHRDGTVRRGAGVAGMMYRFGKFGVARSQAEVELGLDGKVTLLTSAADYGQGIETALLRVASQSLGLPRKALRLVNADTELTLDGDVAGASRALYWVGGALEDAACRLRAAIIMTAAEMLDCAPELVQLDGERGRLTWGMAQVSLASVAAEMAGAGQARRIRGVLDLSSIYPEAREGSYLPFFLTGANVAEVEVDISTGMTKVLTVAAAHDVGKTVNRRDAIGQVEGGIVMGLGSALMEELVPGQSTGFSTYAVPTIGSVPEMRVHLVEVLSRHSPHGGKGLGEATFLPTPPAIINAISRAIGVRLRRTPATPERVLAALANR